MTDLRQTAEFIFKNRSKYNTLSSEDKEYIFFIFNRFCAKKFPHIARILNRKYIQKDIALDIWYNMFKSSLGIPTWFYAKNTISTNNNLSENDKLLLELFENINISELNILKLIDPDYLDALINDYKSNGDLIKNKKGKN